MTSHRPTAAAALRTLPFDQLHCQALVVRLLDRFAGPAARPRPLAVLDVSSRIQDCWDDLLDPARVRVTRTPWPPGRPGRAAEGDDFVGPPRPDRLPFADGAFDVVVSLELLQYVSPCRREWFVRECGRVAAAGLVLSCPDGRPEVEAAERQVADAYCARHHAAHHTVGPRAGRWLPPREDVEAALRPLAGTHKVFNTTPLPVWFPLTLLADTIHERGVEPEEMFGLVNECVNAAASHPTGSCYRKVYACLLPGADPHALDGVDGGPALDAAAAGDGMLNGSPPQLLAAVVAEVLNRTTQERREVRHRLGELTARAEAGSALRRLARACWYRRDQSLDLPDFAPQPGAVPTAAGLWVTGPRASLATDRVLAPGTYTLACTIYGEQRCDVALTGQTADGPVTLFERENFHLEPGVRPRWRFPVYECVTQVRLEIRNPFAPVVVETFRFTREPAALMAGRAVKGWLKAAVGLALRPAKAALAVVRGRKPEPAEDDEELPLDGDAAPDDEGEAEAGAVPPEDPYAVWQWHRRLTPGKRRALRREGEAMARPPLVSVLLAAGDAPLPVLKGAVESVLRQTYGRWELCVAVDESSPRVREALRGWHAGDARVKVCPAAATAGPAAAANAALAVAAGDYVAILDPHDLLAEHALSAVARAIAADPLADVVYGDEDRVDADGGRHDPFFKPDWSPEYFLSLTYTLRLCAYRTRVVRAAGGLRADAEPAAEADLALRVAARTDRFAHVADVLYHRRDRAEGDAEATPAWAAAHARSKADYLRAIGVDAAVEPGPLPGTHLVRPALRGRPRVSIVIPSACRGRFLDGRHVTLVLNCLASIRERSTYTNYEVVVVDNGDAPSEVVTALAAQGVRRVTWRGPFNVAAKMNMGAAVATGDYLLFLNDDTEVRTPDWLESMLGYAQLPGVGAVGAKLLFPDGRVQHAGVHMYGPGFAGHPLSLFPGDTTGYFGSAVVPRNFVAVTGACALMDAAAFREIGGFDETYPVSYNDVEICFRLLRTGRRVVLAPHAQLTHFESVTRMAEGASTGLLQPGELERFMAGWQKYWDHDPYFNANMAIGRRYEPSVEPPEVKRPAKDLARSEKKVAVA